jgi:hypothetical protein
MDPVLERTKTVNVLNHEATLIGSMSNGFLNYAYQLWLAYHMTEFAVEEHKE